MKNSFSTFGPWRGFIVPGLVILGILVSLFLVVQPAYSGIKTTDEEVKRDQKRLDFLTQKVEDLKKLDPEVVDRRLSLLEKAIPSEKDALSGLALLQTVANNSGVSVDSLAVSPGLVSTGSAATETQTDTGVAFKGSLSGSLDQFFNFFDTLSQPTFPLFLPTKIDFSGSSGSQQTGNLVLTMIWLPQPKTFGGEDKPVPTLSANEEEFARWIEQHADSAPSGLMSIDQASLSTASGKGSLF